MQSSECVYPCRSDALTPYFSVSIHCADLEVDFDLLHRDCADTALEFVGVLKSHFCEIFLDAFRWIVRWTDPSICLVHYLHSNRLSI